MRNSSYLQLFLTNLSMFLIFKFLISSSFKNCFLNIWYLKLLNLGQLPKKCRTVSSSPVSHCSQVGEMSFFMTKRCLLSTACPVNMWLTTFICLLDRLFIEFQIFKPVVGIVILLCLQSSSNSHCSWCCSFAQLLRTCLLWLVDTGINSAGPNVFVPVPSLARRSAISLPLCPTWLGIQLSISLFLVPTLLSSFLQSVTVFWFIMYLLRHFNDAWLSNSAIVDFANFEKKRLVCFRDFRLG